MPLPKQLDLGDVPVGDTVSHPLQLSSAASVDFSFSVTVLQRNKHFTVTPLSGTIAADSSASVMVTFTPTRYSTEHMQLQVQLSEYGAEPMLVHVTGSSRPGLVQQQLMTSALAQGKLGPLGEDLYTPTYTPSCDLIVSCGNRCSC